ncbi:MAG: aminotransferase class I/II-fold pyridoxal phosphate-dependent enzyme [Candidatus Bathyarchaeota archaeon]|nr:aminotransferase class I/II-fold pyridoxal phosphate-dependent enzyme [Candidatus Bathyarchaeota archaeon]
MKVDPFKVEKWLNAYELDVEINISETCVDPFTLGEFLRLTGREEFFEEFLDTKLTYGFIPGSPGLRSGLAKLYGNMGPENILVAGGAIGANFLVFYSLVEPGDTVISVHPTYQQLYSVAESFDANVKLLKLRMQDGWLPKIDELAGLVDDRTKLIVINNPNNPTGSLMDAETLYAISDLAEEIGAYLLDDESYRGLYVDPDEPVPSVVEITDRGIATGSLSKTFSLTGLRLGWIAAKRSLIEEFEDRRDYTTISNGMIDDALAAIAVENVDLVLRRNLDILRTNFRILYEWIEGEPLIDWVPPKAGTVAFLRHKLPISSEELCKRLMEEKDVLLVPGSCFDMDGFLRIGFGNNTDVLLEGLSRFKEFLNGYR